MFKVIPIPAFKDNYIWALCNDESKQMAVVDPGDETPVLNFMKQKNYQLCAILVTHHHHDHTGGIVSLLQHINVPVYGPTNNAIAGLSHPLKEHQKIYLEPLCASFEILEIPGHTHDHIAFYGEGCLFCGDTLFLAGCGRLFEGTANDLYHSLQKLAQLPEDTLVYCGHEYTVNNLKFAQLVEPDNKKITQRLHQCETLRNNLQPTVPATLAEEKITNPFLRVQFESIKKIAEKKAGHPLENPVQILSMIRQWKDNF